MAVAGVVAGPLVGAGLGHADPAPTDIPPDTRPGGAYSGPLHLINGQWVFGRGGGSGG